MPRVKRAVHAQKKRRKVLEQAKGYWGCKHSHYRYAKEQVEHSLVYAYRDRKVKKRTFRRLWITRINAAARAARPVVQPVHPRLRQGRASSSTARSSRISRSATRPRSARSPSGPRPRSQSPRTAAGLITSRDNERLKLVRKLHDRRWRDKLGLFVAEGEDLVDAARRRAEPVDLLVAGETVDAGAARRGLDARAPAAGDRRLPARRPAARGRGRSTLALWHVARPGERRHARPVGRCVRRGRRALGRLRRPDRAEGAAGVDGSALPRVRSPASTSRAGAASRSSRTAERRCRSSSSTATIVFVLGAEREGLPDEVLARATCRRRSAARRGESLNVAMAGTVALYERSRDAQAEPAGSRQNLQGRPGRALDHGKWSGPGLPGAGPKIQRAGCAFVHLVQPAFRLGVAPSS